MTSDVPLTIKTIAPGGTATVNSFGPNSGTAISVTGMGTLTVDASVALKWINQAPIVSTVSRRTHLEWPHR